MIPYISWLNQRKRAVYLRSMEVQSPDKPLHFLQSHWNLDSFVFLSDSQRLRGASWTNQCSLSSSSDCSLIVLSVFFTAEQNFSVSFLEITSAVINQQAQMNSAACDRLARVIIHLLVDLLSRETWYRGFLCKTTSALVAEVHTALSSKASVVFNARDVATLCSHVQNWTAHIWCCSYPQSQSNNRTISSQREGAMEVILALKKHKFSISNQWKLINLNFPFHYFPKQWLLLVF